jgi:hypothetical protein
MSGQEQWKMERNPSQGSNKSTSSSSAQSPTTAKPPAKRNSNGFSTVGRHSNEWLFNGFSVTEAAKGLLKRRDS